MTTYKQETKEKSRVEIWTRAVKKLTADRDRQRILKPAHIRRLWDYAFDEIIPNRRPDEKIMDSWEEFSNGLYESRQPQSLKVAYFCGPEPENDLTVMIKLGIKVENVWAIESEKKMYTSALSSAKKNYPTLKVFNGNVSDLTKITSFKFDIIYLDFTASLFSKQSKPLLVINSIFENNSLADLGVLVINGSLPDKTEENVNFLSSYFRSQPFLEEGIFSGKNGDVHFAEGADAYGFVSREDLEYYENDETPKIFEDTVDANFEFAYSAFSSHYPSIVSGYIQPMRKVANNPSLKRMFLKMDDERIKKCIERMSEISEIETDRGADFDDLDLSGSEIFSSHEEFPIWNFLLRLKNSNNNLSNYWYQQFSSKNGGTSYLESVQLYDLLRNAQYSYKNILSENLSKSIREIITALPDPNGGVFCDVPMPHLWIELAINHLGNAHHINTGEHWRAKYRAKNREMYLDMFVLDNCRALYDWLPMVDLYGEYMTSIERQIIVRGCMDAITKQNHYSSFFSYFGANLIGIHTKRWSIFGELDERQDLNFK